jgi:hypothetical protein
MKSVGLHGLRLFDIMLKVAIFLPRRHHFDMLRLCDRNNSHQRQNVWMFELGELAPQQDLF